MVALLTRAVEANVIDLTPELAQRLLEYNTKNRPMRHRYVAKLAGAMRRGEWRLNGETIVMSFQGRLMQGQHRCAAVVASGVTIRVVLVTGVEDDVFPTYDCGIGRTTGDVLDVEGVSNSNTIAAVTRTLHIYRASGSPYHGNPDHQPTRAQQMDLLGANPAIHESARWVKSSKWVKTNIAPSLAGFCHFVFTGADSDAANSFFQGLETGAGLDAGSPILLLRDRLSLKSDKGGMTPLYKAALIFKAFKLHRDGATVKTLRVRTEGDATEKDVFVL